MPTQAATNVGTCFAYAILVPTHAAPPTLAQMLHTCGAPHAKLMPTLGAPNVGTLVATQESCQVLPWVGQMLHPGAGFDISKHL